MSFLKPAKVSVLMTLYNKGAFVEEAVRSVLAQTYTDLELLVVDDASTDDGVDKVRRIADPRIRILESAVNTGRANAANRGYDAAVGEYVAVLDADDVMRPDRIAEQVTFMEAHPEVGIVGSSVASFGDRDTLYRYCDSDALARARSLFGIPVSYGACMVRMSVLVDNGVACDADWKTPGMDHLFVLDVGRHANYANLAEPLIEYRMGAQNMRHGRDPVADGLVLYRAVLGRLGFQATDAELHCHLALIGLPVFNMDASAVAAVERWCSTLRYRNASVKALPAEAFDQELHRRFDALFGPAADHGFRAGLRHVRSSHAWGRLPHLLRRTLL